MTSRSFANPHCDALDGEKQPPTSVITQTAAYPLAHH